MPTPADCYTLVHRGTPGDLEFYRALCTGSSNCLELGCGFGRITLKLLDLGVSVTGIDVNRDLLTKARRAARALPPSQRRALHLEQADMRSFSFKERSFNRIIAPHGSLYCLLTKRDLNRCLRRVSRHLSADGIFAFNGYFADSFHAHAPQGEDSPSPIVSVSDGRRQWVVWEHSVWNRRRQYIDATYSFRTASNREQCRLHVAQRYLLSSEVPGLLASAGLRVVAMFGRFPSAQKLRQSYKGFGLDGRGASRRNASHPNVARTTRHAGLKLPERSTELVVLAAHG